MRELKADGLLPADTRLRSSKYLNKLIEQDHRGVKLRIGPMLGLKRFKTAAITIAGIDLLRRIYKGQFNLGKLRLKDSSAPPPGMPCFRFDEVTNEQAAFRSHHPFAPEPVRSPVC